MPKSDDQIDRSRPGSGEATRSRLLVATASLIAERGWGSVTTRAVAERAGVNQALVHYHFGSMDNLQREAVMARLQPEVQALADELLDDRPVPESIPRVMRLLDHFDLNTEVGVLMAEALLQATRDERIAEAMGTVVDSWSTLLEPRLALAQERGVIRTDIDARSLASVLAAALDGFLIQRMANAGVDPGTAADTLNQLLAPHREIRP